MILYGGSPSNLYGRLCFGCCKLSWMITAIPFEQSRCRSINSFSDYSPRRKKSNQSSGVPPTVTHRISRGSIIWKPILSQLSAFRSFRGSGQKCLRRWLGLSLHQAMAMARPIPTAASTQRFLSPLAMACRPCCDMGYGSMASQST